MNNQDNKDQSLFSVLIVDDEQDVLDTLKEALTETRYKIKCELNPTAALELIEENNFDIVITDLMMPETGGMDLVNAIKKTGSDTYTIVITGHATLNTAIESVQLNVYNYVNKPINYKELQNMVYRATENLSLQRRNKELHHNNKRILANLSLLIDISKIIYQVNDIKSVFRMVDDTLNEYFNFKKSAIIMEDVQTGIFKIVSSHNLETEIENFEFKLPQKMNDVELSIKNESVIYVKNNELILTEKEIPVENNGWLAFFPVSFQDKIMGFLMVQSQSENSSPSSEMIALLNIMASQVAPMMYSLKFDQNKKPLIENDVVYLIRDSINKAQQVLSPITFALIRMELTSPSGDSFSILDMIRTSQSYIYDNIDKSFNLIWQSQDTALVIMPETDFFKAEMFCKKLKNKAEQEYKAKETGAGLVLHFSCLGFPEAGDTAQEITEHLWAKLLQEINSTKNEEHESPFEV